jgi:hypothetical protein
VLCVCMLCVCLQSNSEFKGTLTTFDSISKAAVEAVQAPYLSCLACLCVGLCFALPLFLCLSDQRQHLLVGRQRNTGLQSVRIPSVGIDDQGAQAIADALKASCVVWWERAAHKWSPSCCLCLTRTVCLSVVAGKRPQGAHPCPWWQQDR